MGRLWGQARGPPTAPGGAGSPGSSAGAAPKIGITVMRTLQIGLFPHRPRAGKRRVGVTRRLASGLADACERFLHWENPALKCSAALPSTNRRPCRLHLQAFAPAPHARAAPRTRSALAAIAT